MDKKRIDGIRSRCESATPGPWKVDEIIESFEGTCISRGIRSADCGLNRGQEFELFLPHDAHFIAHARTDIPDLLAYIDELEGRLAVHRRAYES